ncbi:MAG: ATP synthase F1 subunit epsilon [Acidobacteriaceae bacterium]
MAETNSIRVRLVTPDRIYIEGTADSVSLPSRLGYLEALYGHAPLLAELGAGEVTLRGGDVGDRKFFVARGFAEVLPDRVTILAESVTRPNEIDVGDARAELEHGRQMWREAGDESKRYAEANRVIYEAEERLAAAQDAGESV